MPLPSLRRRCPSAAQSASGVLARRLLLPALRLQQQRMREHDSSSGSAAAVVELELRLGRAIAKARNTAPERMQLPVISDAVLAPGSCRFISGAQKRHRDTVLQRCAVLLQEGAEEVGEERSEGGAAGAAAAHAEANLLWQRDVIVVMPNGNRVRYADPDEDCTAASAGAGMGTGGTTSSSATAPSVSPSSILAVKGFERKSRVDDAVLLRPALSTDVRLGVHEERDLIPEYSHFPDTAPAGTAQLSIARIRSRTSFPIPSLCARVDVSDVVMSSEKMLFSPSRTLNASQLPSMQKHVFEVEIEVDLLALLGSSTARAGIASVSPTAATDTLGELLLRDSGSGDLASRHAVEAATAVVESLLILAEHLTIT